MGYEEILAELANKCKITSKRKEILKILVHAKSPLSAKEIFARVRSAYPQISFDTVYRNLGILKDLNIVSQLDFQDGRSRYELNRHQDHHHHMVCLKCGGAWKIPGCPVEYLDVKGLSDDFKVINHRFEIFGFCRKCQE